MEEVDWNPEAGERLGQLIDALGGPGAAAGIAGRGAEVLEAWRCGEAAWECWPIARLCRAAGRSLDWVMLGEAGAGGGLDGRAVEQAAEFVVRATRGFADLQPIDVARAIVQRARDLSDDSALTEG